MRILYALVFLVFTVGYGLAQSDPAGFELEAFEKTAARAEEVITTGEASNDALDTLRGQLSDLRSLALAEQEKYTDRIATITQRMTALGAAPADGETEAPDVTQRRTDLQAELNEAMSPVLVAQEAYQRANGLIREIDDLMRQRTTTRLLKLGPTPLNPAEWWNAVAAVSGYTRQIVLEIGSNWQNESRRAARLTNAPIIAVLLAIGLLLLFRARVWSRQMLAYLNRNASLGATTAYSFVSSLAQLLFPIIGLFVLFNAIDLLDVFDLRGQFLLEAAVRAGIILFIGSWLSRSLLQPNGRLPALVHLDAAKRRQAWRGITLLGLVFALNALRHGIASGAELSKPVDAVLLFPLVLVGGWALIMLGRVVSVAARASGGSEEANPFLTRVGILIGNLSVAAGVVGPVLSAIGYGEAGSRLVFATALSLVLMAGFYILFRLIGMLTGQITQSVVSAGSEQESQRYGALFRIALGFAFICLAIPLLALIWGARVSDLQEVWLYLREGVSLGDTRISITDFLTFVLIFSVGFTLTRLLQSALRSTVLPNTKLDTGGRNAIVTGTGYIGIFLAAMVAITSTGLDLSNLAIVAGALSVGIGFGLQTIVSNFVSGIILLIERPIKEGDWIDVGAYSGYVRKISVRATQVDTFDRATVVIPNADLIAGAVTNWTHRTLTGRVKVPVGVAYDSDPRQVEEILRDIAEGHPMVLRNPAPSVVFMGFGPDSMDFEIRAILRDVNWMLSAKSDMNFEIVERFRAAGIEIPFAQRDVNLKNIGELGAAIAGSRKQEP
ncbi:MAG: mechanosensitive ion channel family protein [Rhodobacteraceae bacterium]|nr:mechanosensitive ion channel family protein [Paracoccaceae bacterium]